MPYHLMTDVLGSAMLVVLTRGNMGCEKLAEVPIGQNANHVQHPGKRAIAVVMSRGTTDVPAGGGQLDDQERRRSSMGWRQRKCTYPSRAAGSPQAPAEYPDDERCTPVERSVATMHAG